MPKARGRLCLFMRVHSEMITTIRLIHIPICSHGHLRGGGGVTGGREPERRLGCEVGKSPRNKHRPAQPWAWLLLSHLWAVGFLPQLWEMLCRSGRESPFTLCASRG